jgi:hypothetical protein
MQEQPKATGGEQYHTIPTGVSQTPVPTLASQGIDKNLANRAMTSRRVDLPRIRTTPSEAQTCLKLDCSLWELVRASSWWR